MAVLLYANPVQNEPLDWLHENRFNLEVGKQKRRTCDSQINRADKNAAAGDETCKFHVYFKYLNWNVWIICANQTPVCCCSVMHVMPYYHH